MLPLDEELELDDLELELELLDDTLEDDDETEEADELLEPLDEPGELAQAEIKTPKQIKIQENNRVLFITPPFIIDDFYFDKNIIVNCCFFAKYRVREILIGIGN